MHSSVVADTMPPQFALPVAAVLFVAYFLMVRHDHKRGPRS